MDALDVRIVRAMGIVPHGPLPKGHDRLKPSFVAREVGTSINTVKARVAALESTGVIAGYQVVPNLRHLGLAATGYKLTTHADDRKDAVVEALKRVDGILEVHDFIGPTVCVDVAYRDEDDRVAKVRRLVDVAGGDPEPPKFYGREMAIVNGELDALDWRIIQALRWNAGRLLSEVAHEIGVSHWTVKRRHDRMARNGDFYKVPLLDPSKAQGVVPFELLLFLKPGAHKQILGAVLREFDSKALYIHLPRSPESGHFFVFLFAQTTAEVDALVARARALPGVERAEPMFFRGVHDQSRWLDELIAAHATAGMP